MAPCGKSKCDCGCKKKKTTKAKPRAKAPMRKSYIPYSSAVPNQAMSLMQNIPSAVSQVSMPIKRTAEMGTQTFDILKLPEVKKEEIRPIIKPSRYNKDFMVQLGKEKPIELRDKQNILVPNIERRSLNTPITPLSNEPYSSILGKNIALKASKKEYIKKQTGLLTEENRGAPLKEPIYGMDITKFMKKK